MYVYFFQNLGPIWKLFCFPKMGVNMPVEVVDSVLRKQIHGREIIS